MQWFSVAELDLDPKFNTDCKEQLRLPLIYCTSCQQCSPFMVVAARVPEPVVSEVRELLRPFPTFAPDDMLLQLWEALEDKDQERADRIDEQIQRMFQVSPQEFFSIEHKLRQIYHMPPSRIIEPGSFVGPKIVSKRFKPRWDVYVNRPSLYFSRRAGDELLERGFTGIELFPVYTRDGKPSEVYEAVVTGYCGLPKLLSPGGDFLQCEECKRWYLRGDHPLKIGLDPSRWDGSDFFHMESFQGVYVSERAHELLNSPFFSTAVWASFHPMEGQWVHPYFDLSGNLFS